MSGHVPLRRRSLRYYWRTHLAVVLTVLVASAVLTGALAVGDSIRHALLQSALEGLGRTQLAMAAPGRYVRAELAGELAAALGRPVVAVMQTSGLAALTDESRQANDVQVLGVDETFWRDLAAADPAPVSISGPQAWVNQRLAGQLGLQPGQTLILRLAKPTLLPQEAPLSREQDSRLALRVQVAGIVPDAAGGRFRMARGINQVDTVFMDRSWLAERLEMPGKANTLLVGGAGSGEQQPLAVRGASTTTADAAAAQRVLRKCFRLADAGLEVRYLPQAGQFELRTGRIFLDAPAVKAVSAAWPQGQAVLTYFVNSLRSGGHSTPYSMVAAIGPLEDFGGSASHPASAPASRPAAFPGLPSGRDEIVINSWLAEDLRAQVGHELQLTYWVLGPMRQLLERTSRFRIAGAVPIEAVPDARELMPDFPGLASAASCRDWQPGVPIDLDSIRPKDEKYWDDYRGTPKAYVTLAAAREMWGNRYGDLTAVRVPARSFENVQAAENALLARLSPDELGLSFADVHTQAVEASQRGTDFGGLFVGFSLFLIVAALLLMTMIQKFALDSRRQEIGLLLAVGLPPRAVRRAILGEMGLLALAGAALGVPAGIGYSYLMLLGLGTIWSSSAALPELTLHVEPLTPALAGAVSFVMAMGASYAVLRRHLRQPARALLAEMGDSVAPHRRRRGVAMAAAAAVGICLAWAALGLGAVGPDEPMRYFLLGSLLLAELLLLILLALQGAARGMRPPTAFHLVLRGAGRRLGRSMLVVFLLAGGSFLVLAVGAYRPSSSCDAWDRRCGTGGFAFLGRLAIPLYSDLNDPKVRAENGLDGPGMRGVRIVPLRQLAGDDASCRNPGKALQPSLLGVDAAAMDGRFQFVQGGHWTMLRAAAGATPLPALTDQTTAEWGLHAEVGAAYSYAAADGRSVRVVLSGLTRPSILQGNLIVDQESFLRAWPEQTGYRQFLVDVPRAQADAAERQLRQGLKDLGVEIIPTSRLLAEQSAAEDTYISIFQLLGALGLLLGSGGVGLVVLRNVLERRGELALLQALGMSPRRVRRLVLAEHILLLAAALVAGGVAGAVAAAPAAAGGAPWLAMSLALGGGLVVGLAGVTVATSWAMRGTLLAALRNE